MRFLFRMVPDSRDAPSAIPIVRAIASSIGGQAVNPKRTSYGAIEMDVFTESRADFDVFLAAVQPLGKMEFYKDLQETPAFLPVPEAVAEAVSLFNAERFWEAHEVLESIWRVAEGNEKSLLQGLILVCAAFVHHQKGNDEVALGVCRRSLPQLSWDESEYHGIQIGPLRKSVTQMVASERVSLFRL